MARKTKTRNWTSLDSDVGWSVDDVGADVGGVRWDEQMLKRSCHVIETTSSSLLIRFWSCLKYHRIALQLSLTGHGSAVNASCSLLTIQ